MMLTVLVVDDDDTTRKNVIGQLKIAAGKHKDFLEIVQAKTAMGAVRSLPDGVLDLAIIDYHLGPGATGAWLISKLIQKHSETHMCLFSDKDPTVIEHALDEAISSRLTSVQYRKKELTQAEVNNIYDTARNEILKANGDFLFGDLVASYQQAFSAHEQLRIVNLLWERAVRLLVAILAPKVPDIADEFLLESRGQTFISASSFLRLSEKLVHSLEDFGGGAREVTVDPVAGYVKHLVEAYVRIRLWRPLGGFYEKRILTSTYLPKANLSYESNYTTIGKAYSSY